MMRDEKPMSNDPAHAANDRAGKAGAMLALASLPVHFALPPGASQQLAAVSLTLIAGIYVGFAVQDGRRRIVATEGAVALMFAACALLGLWASAWVVPAAFALHGFWDLAHHRRVTTAMPRWYVPFCAIYDWVFAGGLAVSWWA